MRIRDLINMLEELEKNEDELWRAAGQEPGQAEIMIDVFRYKVVAWKYQGISKDIRITRSGDGVYPILSAIDGD